MSECLVRKLPECLDTNRHGMRVLGRDMRLEELTEISVFQVFHHDAVRFLPMTGAEDSSDIAIFQSSQNSHVSLKVQPVGDQSGSLVSLYKVTLKHATIF